MRNSKGQFVKGSKERLGKPSPLRGKSRPPFSEKWKRNIGLGQKGRTPWNKGKKASLEIREKQRQAKLKNPTRYWLGKRRECIAGKNHYNWRGGISKLARTIRHSYKYRQWRSDVFTRDDFTCQSCSKKGDYLEAHHLKRLVKILEEYNIKTIDGAFACEELWNINNGRTLCLKCHNKTKNGQGKII
jgi:5-methylcytosine-specific restriction endonuclease McrA